MTTWVWLTVVKSTLNLCVLDVCMYLCPDRVLWITSYCFRSLQLVYSNFQLLDKHSTIQHDDLGALHYYYSTLSATLLKHLSEYIVK